MKVKVYGNKKVSGKVKVSGSKNAALPIICASLLNKNKVVLKNVPRISDVFDIINILKYLDCKIKFKRNTLIIDSANLNYKPLLLEECQKIRASYYFVGIFLSIYNKCEILLPGGCNIGKRPIDYHLKAFSDMGYIYTIEDNVLNVRLDKELSNIDICISDKSVGASMNAILASTKFKKAKLSNLLIEPECEGLIKFLNIMGYNYTIHKDEVTIKSFINNDQKVKYRIIPDRIEAMTFTVIGLLCGKLKIKKCNPNHLLFPLNILVKNGFKVKINKNSLYVYKSVGNQINIETDTYPGFPTDLQSIFGVLASQTNDNSQIVENIFENRMQIYYDLIKSGIRCNVKDNKVDIVPGKVKSANYKSYDLRHGAAVIILSLIGDKSSFIENFEVVLRGYEDLLRKLRRIGVKIEKIK